MVKPPVKQTYKVRVSGWVAGERAEQGDLLELTDVQAKYEPVDLDVPAADKPAAKRRPEADAP